MRFGDSLPHKALSQLTSPCIPDGTQKRRREKLTHHAFYWVRFAGLMGIADIDCLSSSLERLSRLEGTQNETPWLEKRVRREYSILQGSMQEDNRFSSISVLNKPERATETNKKAYKPISNIGSPSWASGFSVRRTARSTQYQFSSNCELSELE